MQRVLVGVVMLLAGDLALCGLGVQGTALAACAAPYTTDALLEDMIGIESALRTSKADVAGATAAKLEAGLPCLDSALPGQLAGRTYRAIGGGYLLAGNGKRATEWFLTAVEIESGFDYGLEDLPADHPVREAWSQARNAPPSDPVQVAGGTWTSGKILLDGRTQSGTPQGRPGRPHLLQVVDGASVRGWLVEGNAFPTEALGVAAVAVPVAAAGKAPKAPKAAKPPKGMQAVPVGPEAVEPVVAAADPVPPEPEPQKPAKAPKPAPVAEPVPAVADVGPEEAPKVDKEPKVEKEPKVAKGKENDVQMGTDGAMVIDRQRPWQKTPLLIGGGAMLAGAGLLYWQSSVHHSAFMNDPSVNTQEEVLAEQSATNTFFLASGALLAVGAGTLTWGVVLDGGGIALPTFGFNW